VQFADRPVSQARADDESLRYYGRLRLKPLGSAVRDVSELYCIGIIKNI